MPTLFAARSISGKRCNRPDASIACRSELPAGSLRLISSCRPGNAYATCTEMESAIGGIHLRGALHKGIDEGIGDVMEHGSERLFQQAAGELVMKMELYLARGIAQRLEQPGAVEVLERSVAQPNLHQARRLLVVVRRKARLDSVVMDMDRGDGAGVAALDELGAAAPGKEQRIVLHAVDQLEHLLDAIFDENGFPDLGHRRLPDKIAYFKRTAVRDPCPS